MILGETLIDDSPSLRWTKNGLDISNWESAFGDEPVGFYLRWRAMKCENYAFSDQEAHATMLNKWKLHGNTMIKAWEKRREEEAMYIYATYISPNDYNILYVHHDVALSLPCTCE